MMTCQMITADPVFARYAIFPGLPAGAFAPRPAGRFVCAGPGRGQLFV